MMLLGLPNEILFWIAESLDEAGDIFSFVRVNKRTFRLLLSILYKFNIQRQDSSALCWAAQYGQTRLVEQMVHQYRCNVNAVHNGNTPLISAASNGSTAIVDVLLSSRQIRVNMRNLNGETALWCAAWGGHGDVVARLLQRDDIDVNIAAGKLKVTPLALAVKKGHAEIVRCLLTIEGVNVNSEDRYSQTPVFHALSRAIETSDREILKMVLAKEDADLSHRDNRGFTPLTYAVRRRNKSLSQLLLSHPTSSTERRDLDGRTALWHAVRKRDADIIKLLLEKGADIAAPDAEGETPFHQSIRATQPSLTKLLLSLIYRPEGRSAFNLPIADAVLPPLCLAATLGNTEIVQLLLDHGWNANETDAERQTPLHFAAKAGYYKVVRVLLNHRQLDVNARDQWGSTALHDAAHGGHSVVVNLLLTKADIDINAEDENGCTPLWCATRHGHHGVALRLLNERNVNVNAVGQSGTYPGEKSTSLHHAVKSRSPQIVQRLVAKRTLNPNIINHDGQTPLSWAAHDGDLQIMECLLRRPDVRVNAVEENEQPPLWSAASQGHVQVVQRLLQCPQINVNQGWAPYQSPLQAAIVGGHSDVAMQLLRCETRLDVNARTYLGESALSLAAYQGHLSVVDSLLQDRRVDPNDVDKMGRTAFWWAADGGQAGIVERLLADDRVLTHLKDKEGMDALDAARRQNHFDVARLIWGIRRSADSKASLAPSEKLTLEHRRPARVLPSNGKYQKRSVYRR